MIDPERFSALFATHAALLVLYARQWLDRAAAEDVVQEAFVRLLLQRTTPDNVKAWLFTAVRNESLSQARSSLRRRRREERRPRQTWFEPPSVDSGDATAAANALQGLPAAQREVIVLRIWGQLTLKETASVIGSSTSTVFDQYRAGIAALRKEMGVACQSKNE